jgi:hypothetical protein
MSVGGEICCSERGGGVLLPNECDEMVVQMSVAERYSAPVGMRVLLSVCRLHGESSDPVQSSMVKSRLSQTLSPDSRSSEILHSEMRSSTVR